MPKIVDHEARRRRIADAAIGAIAASGLDRVRLVDVARAVDATTGSITHYFDSKDEMLAAAVSRVAELLIAGLEHLEDEDLIDAAALALPLDAAGRRDWQVWLAFWGRAVSAPALAAVHNDYYARMRALLAAAIRRHQARGAIAAALDPGEGADAVIAAVDGIGVRASLDPKRWPAARQRAALRTLLAPVFAPESGPSRPRRRKTR
jgi:TetR/AcrR family transcriptional repressor of bet genes